MSKLDQIRALRESQYQKPAKKVAPKSKVVKDLRQAVEPASDDETEVRKTASHPDCPRCNANREMTRNRMRKYRAGASDG